MTQIVVLDGKDERYVLNTATVLKKQLAQYGFTSSIHSDFEPPEVSKGRVLQRSYRESLVWANRRLSSLKLDESYDVHIVLGYLGREMEHLGSLIETTEERRGYYLWLDAINHQMLELPRPAATYFLSFDKKAPTEVSYVEITRLFPKDFTVLDCSRSNGTLSPDQTAALISTKLEALLQPPQASSVIVENEPPSDNIQTAFIEGLNVSQQHLARLVEPVALERSQLGSMEGMHHTDNTVCRVVEVLPKNELTLRDIAHYQYSSSPLHLRNTTPYAERANDLTTILSTHDLATEHLTYVLELRLPYYLVNILPTKSKIYSKPTIRHGYLFPEEILQDEKLSTAYEACYDAANDTFNRTQSQKKSPEGGILGGHFVYVLATFNYEQVRELVAESEFAVYRGDIIDAIGLHHPLIASSLV